MRSFFNKFIGYPGEMKQPLQTKVILQEIKNLPSDAQKKEPYNSDRSATTDTEDLDAFFVMEVDDEEDKGKIKRQLTPLKKDDPPLSQRKPSSVAYDMQDDFVMLELAKEKELQTEAVKARIDNIYTPSSYPDAAMQSDFSTAKIKPVAPLSLEVPVTNSPNDKEDKLFSTFHVLNEEEDLPNKNRPADDYILIKKNPSRSFHVVDQAIKKNPKDPNNNPVRFFKHNPLRSVMSVLEAVGGAVFKFIAPKNAPSARAHFKEGENEKEKIYVGVSSKGFPGFKSLREETLVESDLEIEALKYFTVPELEDIDQRAIAENYDLTNKVDEHVVTSKDIQTAKGVQEVVVTVADLRNYRISKGLGVGLTTSYACCEGDCHKGNIDKYGIRIDFDMIFWDYYCNYKESGIIDWSFRFPNDQTFIVTPKDIIHLPNLEDANFFYWPTKQTIIPEPFLSKIKKVLSISENAYTIEDNLVFQKLETHPVFVYHKYATFLKFMLTDIAIYRSLINLYVGKDIFVNGVNILENFYLHLRNRIATVKKVLSEMPEFYKYLSTTDSFKGEQYGDIMLNSILNEFEEHNNKYAEKMKKCSGYKNLLINLDEIKQEYIQFMKNAKERYTDGVVSEFSVMEIKKEETVAQENISTSSLNKKFN